MGWDAESLAWGRECVCEESFINHPVGWLSWLREERIPPAMQETWVGKISWRREQLPTPVFLPEESMDKGAWQATVNGVTKSQT